MSIPSSLLTITLNGTKYAIAPANPDEQNYMQGPQPQFPEVNADVFWQTWTQKGFQQGERRKHILSQEDLTNYRYDDGEGIDVGNLAEFGEVKLQPSITRSMPIQSATMPMAVSSDGTTLLVGVAASPFVEKWTIAGWSAAATGLTGAVTDIIAVGSTFYAVAGGVPFTSTDAGATWSALSGAHTGVVGIAYANGDVYLLKSGTGAGRVYNHTQGALLAANGPISDITGTVIAGYKENVYWGADSRLYLYNGRSVTMYDKFPDGFTMTALLPYRTILLILGYIKIRSGYKGAVYYIIQGSENHLYSLGNYAADHRIYAMAGDFDAIWLASPKRGGADRYDLTEGGLSSGPATGTAMYTPFKSMAVCEGYLWIGRYDNVVGTDGVWQADLAAPTAWRASGWLTTSEYDYGYPNAQKLLRDVRVEHRALVTGQSVVAAYSLDGGVTYTTALTSNTVGATNKSATLSNIKADSLKFKVTLASGGTNTPTFLKLTARAAPVSEAKQLWQFKTISIKKFGGKTLMTAVKAAHAAAAQLAFIDVDGSAYNVIVQDYKILLSADPKRDYFHLMFTLREV